MDKIKNFIFFELLMTVVNLTNGKHRVLPIFYNAREWRENSWGSCGVNINNLITENEHKEEYEYFLQICENYMNKKFKINRKDFQSLINRYAKHYEQNKSSVKLLIYKILPKIFIEYIKDKRLLLHIQSRIQKVSSFNGFPYGKNCEDIQEFEKIKHYIKKFDSCFSDDLKEK